jgi:hypothetical protein
VKVFNFAGSVLQQWQPNTHLLHANQQNKDQQIQPQLFKNECEALCKDLKELAGKQKKRRVQKFMQWILHDRKRLARLDVLKSRLESIKATLNLSMTAMHLRLSQHSKVHDANDQR